MEVNFANAIEDEEQPKMVTKEEIQDIIKYSNNRKAPGLDKISNAALKNLPEKGLKRITEITNAVLELRHFPEKWKTSEIILIQKPNKPSNQTQSYRPISLLSTISKTIEKTIHTRLTEIVEKNQIIPHHQFGFRNNHSTTQVLRLTEKIMDKFNTTTATGMVFLDIEKAFDTVWHQDLLYKLNTLKLPNWIIKLVKSYLNQRAFKIKIEDSTTRIIQAGVPQGSVLGPLLFNLFITDLPKLKHCKVAQFAHDTTPYLHSRRPETISNRLTEDLENLTKWLTTRKIKLNVDKTVAIHFAKKGQNPTNYVTIEGTKLKWSNEAKYLGIVLGKKLTFQQHLKELKKKVSYLLCKLYPLLRRNSKMNIQNKLTITKTIFIPTLLYGCEIWSTANPNLTKKIQISINKALRLAVNADWYISNEQIRNETNTPTLEEIIVKRTGNLIEKIKTHKNPIINNLQNPRPPRKTDTHQGIINRHYARTTSTPDDN